MSDMLFAEWVGLLAVCLITASAAMLWMRGKGRTTPDPAGGEPGNPVVFLFDDKGLIDASAGAMRFLGGPPETMDWPRLRRLLMHRYPGFPETADQVRDAGRFLVPELDSTTGSGALCEWIDGITRVELCEPAHIPDADAPVQAPDSDISRLAMDAAPYPVWRLNAAGQVRWHNTAYADLVAKIKGSESEMSAPLFKQLPNTKGTARRGRVAVDPPTAGKKLWFDVTVIENGDCRLCYAVDVNAVVDAEIAQRNFVQTLAKTFAQLSIGLAIFDRNRQLALFNPALIDLTALPADFLSGRPNLFSFFDRLRDRNMMPEPKNYESWRERMSDLAQAASEGHYQETWSLPSGSVYSVSGRPHPDGAVAFLFEDITAEITLTRRFRSELELGQSVMDTLDDGIAVFSPDGTLAFSNAAYNQMWAVDPDASFAKVTVVDATRVWQEKCMATPLWGEIRDFVNNRETRSEWWAAVRRRDGRAIDCTIHPIPNGATAIRFRVAQHGASQKQLEELAET